MNMKLQIPKPVPSKPLEKNVMSMLCATAVQQSKGDEWGNAKDQIQQYADMCKAKIR